MSCLMGLQSVHHYVMSNRPFLDLMHVLLLGLDPQAQLIALRRLINHQMLVFDVMQKQGYKGCKRMHDGSSV